MVDALREALEMARRLYGYAVENGLDTVAFVMDLDGEYEVLIEIRKKPEW